MIIISDFYNSFKWQGTDKYRKFYPPAKPIIRQMSDSPYKAPSLPLAAFQNNFQAGHTAGTAEFAEAQHCRR